MRTIGRTLGEYASQRYRSMKAFGPATLRGAALALTLISAAPEAAFASEWSCYGAKPGHPTADERLRFIHEASELAVKAEKKHGVPAAALAAIAIAESTYGWTRPALEANNLFAWKAPRSLIRAGKAYIPPCQRGGIRRTGYVAFASRAEAFDHVASRLKTMDAYRRHTEAYRLKRKQGEASPEAVDAWLSGIARRYSGRPTPFVSKIKRIMNDPTAPSDTLSAEHNLYRLSTRVNIRALE